ncbi:hypothetical protein C8J56DRAFT_1165402 [Mycena floridula]|nr:hypothetical protein C8J56DRAFT_1165402 [Mycena floridula]
MSSTEVTELDIKEITECAHTLALRDEWVIEQQSWKSNATKDQVYYWVNEAEAKWVKAAIETKAKVEEAKKDVKNGTAKLKVLGGITVALQPDNFRPIKSPQARFEYVGELSDTTQGLWDMIAKGTEADLLKAIKGGEALKKTVVEMVAARVSQGLNGWITSVNQGQRAEAAFMNVMKATVNELYPSRVGSQLTLEESVMVQATAIVKSGRSVILAELVEDLVNTAADSLRGIVIGLAILVYDIVDAALNGGVGTAVVAAIKGVASLGLGIGAGMIAEAFVTDAVLAVAGATAAGIIGVAAGAIVGFAVGAAVVALIDLICSLFVTDQGKLWREYLDTPILSKIEVPY